MLFTRWRSFQSSSTVRSSVSSLVARWICPIRTNPVFRSTTVTRHALPRPCIVSISQSPIRPRLSTTAGLCPISLFPASRPRLSYRPYRFRRRFRAPRDLILIRITTSFRNHFTLCPHYREPTESRKRQLAINCRWIAFSMTVTAFTAQPFDAFLDDDGKHHQRGHRISPPPAEQCVECKAAQ